MCKFLAIETQLPGPTVCMREEQEGEGEGGGRACQYVSASSTSVIINIARTPNPRYQSYYYCG